MEALAFLSVNATFKEVGPVPSLLSKKLQFVFSRWLLGGYCHSVGGPHKVQSDSIYQATAQASANTEVTEDQLGRHPVLELLMYAEVSIARYTS